MRKQVRRATLKSGAPVRALVLLGSVLFAIGCKKVPELPHHNAPTYHFLLGPTSQPKGPDRRVAVDAPSRFVELEQEPTDKPIELSEFTFAYRYPDLQPVRRDQLAEPGVVVATVGWEPPGSVRKRIDGSWQNHYSRYYVKHKPEYGLETATGDDLINTSMLFYSVNDEVMIECVSSKGEPLRGCHLMTKIRPYAVLELRFPASMLPNWRDIIAKTSSIFAIRN